MTPNLSFKIMKSMFSNNDFIDHRIYNCKYLIDQTLINHITIDISTQFDLDMYINTHRHIIC